MENEENKKLGINLDIILNDKNGENLGKVIEKVLTNKIILREVLKGLVSKNEIYRYNCFKVLFQVSISHPAELYPEWDYFLNLLGSSNAYHRMSAIHILYNLTSVDIEKRFDQIFDQYFLLSDDPSMIIARYLAGSAGKIARVKPYLQSKIVDKLLGIDKTHHREDRKDLIKYDIIQSFSEFFENISEKERIFSFVEKQLNCSSPKTRKMAQEFLKRFSK